MINFEKYHREASFFSVLKQLFNPLNKVNNALFWGSVPKLFFSTRKLFLPLKYLVNFFEQATVYLSPMFNLSHLGTHPRGPAIHVIAGGLPVQRAQLICPIHLPSRRVKVPSPQASASPDFLFANVVTFQIWFWSKSDMLSWAVNINACNAMQSIS